MTSSAISKAIAEVEARGQRAIAPQPGPQTDFLSSKADIIIFGGAAGGGKTFGGLMWAAMYHHVPGYTALVLRRTAAQATKAGGIWDASHQMYPLLGGKSRGGSLMDWRWFGAEGEVLGKVQFSHLQHEKDVHDHQGAEYTRILFDEGTHFTELQFWYLLSRNRSTCGVRTGIAMTCNPDPDSFIRELIDWWIGADGYPIYERSGILRYFVRIGDDLVWADTAEEALAIGKDLAEPKVAEKLTLDGVKSLTFIPSRLEDNQVLMKSDPQYQANLLTMAKVERERLEGGNWDIRADAGSYFKRAWFEVVDEDIFTSNGVNRICYEARAWDLAFTKPHPGNPDPDWTRGVKGCVLTDGSIVITDMVGIREGGAHVTNYMKRCAEMDGTTCEVGIWQDPAGGKYIAETIKDQELRDFSVRVEPALKSKEAYAVPVSAAAEQRRIKVLRGPWNAEFFKELESFPPEKDSGHDDIVDALSRLWQLLSAPRGVGYRGTSANSKTGFRRGGERRGVY